MLWFLQKATLKADMVMWYKKLTLFKKYPWFSFIKPDSGKKKQQKYKVFAIKSSI